MALVIESLLPFGVLKHDNVKWNEDIRPPHIVIESLLPFGVLKLCHGIRHERRFRFVIEGLLPFGVLKLFDAFIRARWLLGNRRPSTLRGLFFRRAGARLQPLDGMSLAGHLRFGEKKPTRSIPLPGGGKVIDHPSTLSGKETHQRRGEPASPIPYLNVIICWK